MGGGGRKYQAEGPTHSSTHPTGTIRFVVWPLGPPQLPSLAQLQRCWASGRPGNTLPPPCLNARQQWLSLECWQGCVWGGTHPPAPPPPTTGHPLGKRLSHLGPGPQQLSPRRWLPGSGGRMALPALPGARWSQRSPLRPTAPGQHPPTPKAGLPHFPPDQSLPL